MVDDLIREDILIPLVAIVCTFSWFIIATLSHAFKGVFATWRDSRLKEKMLERGFSADEIAAVLSSGKPRCETRSPRRKRGSALPVSDDAYSNQVAQTNYQS